MKKVLFGSILLSAVGMVGVANAQSQELNDNFNINYTVQPSCDMSLEKNNMEITFLGVRKNSGDNTFLFVKCTNTTPYTISHIPQEKSEYDPNFGAMTGANTGVKIGYTVTARYGVGHAVNFLSEENVFEMIGDGKRQMVNLSTKLSYDLDHTAPVDIYTGVSTIKLSF